MPKTQYMLVPLPTRISKKQQKEWKEDGRFVGTVKELAKFCKMLDNYHESQKK